VLGGRRDPNAGTLVYRWPSSPMRLSVDVDATADEGPVAVEFVSDRPVPVPGAPPWALGVRFQACAP
jgi:hypothetical protein